MMNVTLLVKLLESGQFEASLLGLPACRVEAESRELAIDGLKKTLLEQVQDAEVVSLQLPIVVASHFPHFKCHTQIFNAKSLDRQRIRDFSSNELFTPY
jgi:hypothetical protein